MIFLCYRRTDVPHMTDRIGDRLISRFGEHSLFKDVDAIQPGENWVRRVQDAVSRCDLMLAIIGDHWTIDEFGERRFNENDHVEIELAAAIDRGIPIIPVLVDRKELPLPEEIPESLRTIFSVQALPIGRDPNFNNGVARLVRACELHCAPRTRLVSLRSFVRDPARYRQAGFVQIVCFVLLAAQFLRFLILGLQSEHWAENEVATPEQLVMISGLSVLASVVAVYLGAMFVRGALWHSLVATAHIAVFLIFSLAVFFGAIEFDAGETLDLGHKETLFGFFLAMAVAMLATSIPGLFAIVNKKRNL